MKRVPRLFVILVLFLAAAGAQTAKVKRNVVLRTDPSSSSDKIATLKPPATLTLVKPASKYGFLHVTTADGDTGWVWARFVEVQDEGDSEESDEISKLLAAHTDAVGQPLIENGQSVCGPTGDAKDGKTKALNANKNRTDIPDESAYVLIGWAQLRDLPSERANDLPGAPVVAEGFLVHRVKVENDGKGESTNCHLLDPSEVDWHIYFSDTAGRDDISEAVIVETTPRTRPLHKWKKSDLDAIVNKDIPIRISGWLLYDFEHTGAIGSQRATVWELHPITKIEIKRNRQWVDLDK